MRKFLLLFVLVFGMGAFASAQETGKPSGYVINGTIHGDYKGKVYLVREESLHGLQTVIDSVEVVDGNYHFEGGNVDVVMLHFIKSNDGQLTPLFLENGTINIEGDARSFLWATVTGTPNNDLRELYKMATNYVKDSTTRATVVDWKIYGRGDAARQEEEYKRRSKHIEWSWLRIQSEMAKKYNDQVFAPFIVLFEMFANAELEDIIALREQLAPAVASHPYTLALDEFIASQNFGVGSQAADFTLPSLDGKTVSLSDYKGKYVFLDFWATWCGPCRQEMPNMVELYKKYGKDLVIIGISLDKDKDVEKWKAAVKEMGMKWVQCRDGLEFYGDVARNYKVAAIPRTVLIDPSGKVVALNLRGENLVEEVGKFLNK